MADRVEVYVHDHWCAVEPDCTTVEQALGIYTEIDHPDLGTIVVVPSHFPMRGPRFDPATLELVVPANGLVLP